jgi:hypothetical protein
VLGFIQPDRPYAVAEDRELFDVLARVPAEGALLVASDLADPAQDFARPLQGMLLTAYRGHTFYAANLSYIHYTRPDALVRLQELRSFFGAPWSMWHTGWLARTRVTHVLTDDRCAPAWLGQPGPPLQPLTRSGRWTAYEVRRPARGTQEPERPAAEGPRPAYGRADCLSGRNVTAR